jgi:hypothetical protein
MPNIKLHAVIRADKQFIRAHSRSFAFIRGHSRSFAVIRGHSQSFAVIPVSQLRSFAVIRGDSRSFAVGTVRREPGFEFTLYNHPGL